MGVYVGIDLHSNNSYVAVVDAGGRLDYEQRLANRLEDILPHLGLYGPAVSGVVVESTYNWYWLVDGLMEAGYRVHLANPAAIQQYSGLKHRDDRSDARWLAEMLRLGVLPEGYIYPREERPLRDLLRKRGQLVRQRTANLLSLQNQLHRTTGQRWRGDAVRALRAEQLPQLLSEPDQVLAAQTNLEMVQVLSRQIRTVEKRVREGIRPCEGYRLLQSVPGVGEILASTIVLETGKVERFGSVGHYASYCRCVSSQKFSNGKRKGQGNVRNGNKYLAWAYLEAAHFAVRYSPRVRRFYQRKQARRCALVGLKAVAHKLARASYYILRDRVAFELQRAF